MPAQALAALATLLSFSQQGNRVELRLDRGAAEMVWLSPTTFRFRRVLDGPLGPAVIPGSPPPVHLDIENTSGQLRIRSSAISVTLEKHGLLVSVRKPDGTLVMQDASEPAAQSGAIAWDRQMPADARYYGLGPRPADSFDLRGRTLDSEFPLLLSTAGYGEFHAGPRPIYFDFTAPDRYRIRSARVDYYFYYGPLPKAIFEAHKSAGGFGALWQPEPAPPRQTLLLYVQAAMSAIVNPFADLSAFDTAAPDLRRRARQLFSLVPHVKPGAEGLSGFRSQLATFFGAYDPEVDYKGFPVWHPLPFEFPEDPECARHVDEFMLGDEMLIAPLLEGTSRSVYLPRGVWTNLETDAVTPGRQTIGVETPALPVFARNGAIVPLDSPAGIALHYFPELGAEFFISEPSVNDYTQIHAAPAGDEMRLEIESKVDRDYQWVVHHVGQPATVGFENQQYRAAPAANRLTDRTYYYDAKQRSLQIRVHVKAREDNIVNLTFSGGQ